MNRGSIIGSSLEVAPAGFLPELSGDIVIINRGPTALDHKASLKIEGDIARVFETLSLLIMPDMEIASRIRPLLTGM